jgi:hypothetical protein
MLVEMEDFFKKDFVTFEHPTCSDVLLDRKYRPQTSPLPLSKAADRKINLRNMK